jgi:hypothetical protein
MIKPKLLPVWMVIFAFVHFGLSSLAIAQGWSAIATLLSFPLSQAPPDRFEAYLFANSVLWAISFAALIIFLTRPKRLN